MRRCQPLLVALLALTAPTAQAQAPLETPPTAAPAPGPGDGSVDEPVAAKPPSTPPAAAPLPTPGPDGEPAVVDGWTLLATQGPRRLPDGRETLETCGYQRDVLVEKSVDGAKQVHRAALNVPCVKSGALLVAGTPFLKLPPEALPPAPPPTTTGPDAAPPTKTCAPGEKPKATAELKAGELACVEAPKVRPCKDTEKPAVGANGAANCQELPTDRGVPFLKGELTTLGGVQLVNARNSVGVALGADVIDNVYYAVVRPDVNLKFGPFALGLGAPLRFEVMDLNGLDLRGDLADQAFGGAGTFRTEDWDQVEDFLRPLRYLTWGRKEDRIFVDINRVRAITIGHGQLVRRYSPNLDLDEDNLFAEVDGYTDFGGVELFAGPFPIPRLVGGLAFIKPIGFLDSWMAKSLSFGVSYVADLNAPTSLDKIQNAADGRPQLAVDTSNQFVWRNRQNPVGDVVQGVGVDGELKVWKNDFIDIKTYADYTHLFFPADSGADNAYEAFDGGGGTVGGLVRMSFGEKPVRDIDDEDDETRAGRKPREKEAAHAVRLRLEGRMFSAQYLPSYFNTTYEVDRLQMGIVNRNARAGLPTKIGFLAEQAGGPLRAGYYAEASYAWVDAVGVTAVFEDAYALGPQEGPIRARNLALHVETQGLGWLQLFASYHFRNFDDFDGIFTFNTDNEIFYFGGRLQVLPVMFVNVGVQRAFRVGFSEEDQPGQLNAKGERFTSIGLENVWAGTFDVEVGWQF